MSAIRCALLFATLAANSGASVKAGGYPTGYH